MKSIDQYHEILSVPDDTVEGRDAMELWHRSMLAAEKTYKALLNAG